MKKNKEILLRKTNLSNQEEWLDLYCKKNKPQINIALSLLDCLSITIRLPKVNIKEVWFLAKNQFQNKIPYVNKNIKIGVIELANNNTFVYGFDSDQLSSDWLLPEKWADCIVGTDLMLVHLYNYLQNDVVLKNNGVVCYVNDKGMELLLFMNDQPLLLRAITWGELEKNYNVVQDTLSCIQDKIKLNIYLYNETDRKGLESFFDDNLFSKVISVKEQIINSTAILKKTKNVVYSYYNKISWCQDIIAKKSNRAWSALYSSIIIVLLLACFLEAKKSIIFSKEINKYQNMIDEIVLIEGHSASNIEYYRKHFGNKIAKIDKKISLWNGVHYLYGFILDNITEFDIQLMRAQISQEECNLIISFEDWEEYFRWEASIKDKGIIKTEQMSSRPAKKK